MFFLAFLPSVEIVSKIWQRALIFFPSPFFSFFFSLSLFLAFFLSPPLCNFSIQTYLWFGHQQIYILVFNDRSYVTLMSNIRVGEEREAIAEGDSGCTSAQLYDPRWLIAFFYSYWWKLCWCWDSLMSQSKHGRRPSALECCTDSHLHFFWAGG